MRMVRLLAVRLAPIAVTLLNPRPFVIKAMGQTKYTSNNSNNASLEVRIFKDFRLVLLTTKATWSILTDKTERPRSSSVNLVGRET